MTGVHHRRQTVSADATLLRLITVRSEEKFMEIEEISQEFKRRQPLYKHLEGEALFILEQALSSTDIKLHSISSRVKSHESFLDKINKKQISEPFDEMQDIVGLRIVCLFLTDINKITKVIKEKFSVISEDNKIDETDASSFGYMSVHCIANMKKEYIGPRYDHISKYPFEIQVRTIAMEAWANVSHYLDYKSETDVPTDLKRDFFALSGLFYVADKHFEMFYKTREKSKTSIDNIFKTASPQKVASQELNLDTLKALLGRRFPDRSKAALSSISELLIELIQNGYKTIGEVSNLIDRTYDAFLAYEAQHPPGSGKYNPVGIMRTCAGIYSNDFVRIQFTRSAKKDGKSVNEDDITKRIENYDEFRPLMKN
jgi:ppGpp synthetase/RelA/SpoT-type nucleotidyltranferase